MASRLNDRQHQETIIEELEDVIYRVSHDLQAPVRRLNAFSGLLARRLGSDLDERAGQFLERLQIDAQLAQRRLSALLEYSRIGRDWAIEPLPVDTLIEEIQRRTEPLAARQGKRLEIHGTGVLHCEPTSLRKALVCLMDNAVRYAKQRIEVHIHAEGHRWRIRVTNDGPPLPERESAQAFNLFYSDDPENRAGLGLTVIRRVMRLHGGHAHITSTQNGVAVELTVESSE